MDRRSIARRAIIRFDSFAAGEEHLIKPAEETKYHEQKT